MVDFTQRTQDLLARIPDNPSTVKLRDAAARVLALAEQYRGKGAELAKSRTFAQEGPKELSGIPDAIYQIVESARLEQLHGPALREIEEMEAAVAEATAAADVGRNDLRAASGLEERVFERVVESIERRVTLPWLKR